MTNAEIAARLEEIAHLLHGQDADPFRVDAYRRAAATIRTLHEPVRDIFEREGLAGLDRIPSVGPVIARAIRSLVLTGHLPMLDRLRGEAHPVSVLATVPGVGPKLAERLEEELGVRTLEELETAAHDGRLAAIPGFGAKRVRSIRDARAGRRGRVRAPAPTRPSHEPPIDELLDVDREYREKAAAGQLRRIAPRRFNPQGEAWLPILHTRRGGRHYTALYSNTAQAHRLGKTRDWVVLYYDGGDGEHQSTVVTATRGPCAGQRVVRGRERESPCARAPRPAPRPSRSRRSHGSTRA
ncbi:MAG: DNA-binding protein [Gemmatimonadaceae bacterium]|nr:DNA-binding protein [Gemmatimonadaceae bacterium]